MCAFLVLKNEKFEQNNKLTFIGLLFVPKRCFNFDMKIHIHENKVKFNCNNHTDKNKHKINFNLKH